MIALVFSYEVSDAGEFEHVYGPDGDWARVLPRRPRLHRHGAAARPRDPGRYLVIDRWESAQAYDAFVAANRDEYMRRVDETAYLTSRSCASARSRASGPSRSDRPVRETRGQDLNRRRGKDGRHVYSFRARTRHEHIVVAGLPNRRDGRRRRPVDHPSRRPCRRRSGLSADRRAGRRRGYRRRALRHHRNGASACSSRPGAATCREPGRPHAASAGRGPAPLELAHAGARRSSCSPRSGSCSRRSCCRRDDDKKNTTTQQNRIPVTTTVPSNATPPPANVSIQVPSAGRADTHRRRGRARTTAGLASSWSPPSPARRPAGQVLAQNPAAGETLKSGDTVRINVSDGQGAAAAEGTSQTQTSTTEAPQQPATTRRRPRRRPATRPRPAPTPRPHRRAAPTTRASSSSVSDGSTTRRPRRVRARRADPVAVPALSGDVKSARPDACRQGAALPRSRMSPSDQPLGTVVAQSPPKARARRPARHIRSTSHPAPATRSGDRAGRQRPTIKQAVRHQTPPACA